MYFYFDFEYRDNTVAGEVVLLSYMSSTDRTCKTIDLRDGKNRSELLRICQQHSKHTWVAYNASADLTCLLSFGFDISELRVIDAMVEAKMVALTHPEYHSHAFDLLSMLGKFGIKPEISSEFKEQTRQIILANKTYSNWKWRQIKAYGPTDVRPLPHLLKQIWQAHTKTGSPISLNDMLRRGDYIIALTELSYRNKGFPVDEHWVTRIAQHKTSILRHLQEQANSQYGEIFVCSATEKPYSLNQQAFKEFVLLKGYDWELTGDKQLPTLEKSYLKQKVRQHPELGFFYDVRKTMQALNASDLTALTHNGHIKPAIYPFGQKAGRNTHKPTTGFVLNLAPWMRSIIKPQKGSVLIGADWSQQEIGIAAVLSKDPKYLQIYNNADGDVYIALAKMAKAVPQDATKDSHPTMRQTFKAIQLGLGYGKGLKSLATDVYECNKSSDGHYLMSQSEAYELASDIYQWHKSTFHVYWEWIDDVITIARSDGYFRSLDGWTYFVNTAVRDTQLINLPMQSNGAAMLRRAVIRCYQSGWIDLVCTHHDALYISANTEDCDAAAKQLVECMNQACRDILGDKLRLKIDLHVYDSEDGYNDPRGAEMLEAIKGVIADLAA